jgi:hypothetical protein
MIKNDLKRQRRLHRILNGKTNPPDWKQIKELSVVKTLEKMVSLTWWQKIFQWLRKLKPLA